MKPTLATPNKTRIAQEIHNRALGIAARFRRCEFELIEVLGEVDAKKIVYTLGFSSLFRYATSGLGLSEDVAYTYINVARKACAVPALKSELKAGKITVSKARTIAPVITIENAKHWLDLAANNSKRKVEREVAIAAPKTAVKDSLRYIIGEEIEGVKVLNLPTPRVQLQVGISEKIMLRIRRAQEVLAQKKQRPVSLEEVLDALTVVYLQKEDPLERAKRQEIRGKLIDSETASGATAPPAVATQPVPGQVADTTADNIKGKPIRNRIPSGTRHKLTLKFGAQCAFIDENGERCRNSGFLHIHHKNPVANGGSDDLSNLELLCSGHHRVIHTQHRLSEEEDGDAKS